MFEAKIIAHSISEQNKEIITYQLKYPRFIHSEFLTHRLFSRNASSSRAIPVAKMIEQVRTNPAMPIHWGANQPGMQADVEQNTPVKVPEQLLYPYVVHFLQQPEEKLTSQEWSTTPQVWWEFLAWLASYGAEAYMDAGYHKQVVNRRLEADQWISVVVTATEWDNFHALRSHKDAQPEIKLLSDMMLEARAKSTPNLLSQGQWHLPYIKPDDYSEVETYLSKKGAPPLSELVENLLKMVSAARCARVSYLTHDGKPTTVEADLALCERLAGAQPFHASPFEHQATPDEFWELVGVSGWENPHLHGNFVGWIQARKMMDGEHITDYQYS